VYYKKKSKKQNKFFAIIQEKTAPLRKKIKILYQKIMIKGRERLTVMFIPHSEKKIFNFHISNFTLFFALIFISLIVTIAIFSIEKQETTRKIQTSYEESNQQIKAQLDKFVEITNDLVSKTDKVKSTLNQLFKLTGLNSESLFLDTRAQGGPSVSILDNVNNDSNISQMRDNIREIDRLKQVHSDTLQIGERISRLSNHLKRFKTISNHYPSIWPLLGGGSVMTHFGVYMNEFTGKPAFSNGNVIRSFAGTPARATANGSVSEVNFNAKYGINCLIKHGYGFSSRYGFLQDINVKVGQNVKKGDIIGSVGRTGSATDYSLYYEVRIGNEMVDPKDFINFDNYW